MAALTSLSFPAICRSPDRKASVWSTRAFTSDFCAFRPRTSFGCDSSAVRASNSSSRLVVHCMSTATDVPTVAETKLNFLNSYKRPIPSIYNTVLQELIVQQHLMRYKRTYCYDAVFALGFVTVYDQLMEGYPSDEDREAIFQAYIKALQEDPEQYRQIITYYLLFWLTLPPAFLLLVLALVGFYIAGIDAQKMEEWARAQTASTLVDFSSKEGEVEGILKDIAERAGGKGSFSYSRFFAIGLFRLLELANVTEPTILEKLCAALNINKKAVDRDLDVYRNLLSKLVQAKELLKEYVDREKKKLGERAETQKGKANEAITTCLGEFVTR
ncbi:hypothetical protein RJ639_007428 [Escallonia herrerae]|uniref:Uncharacterized protein n=1 Tax=Escallonia herrerae TaxID=1293975 RepID=A0AA88VZ07_9ASTE|nr:hypothetical protein RJ639_007428 [Escallonia herrerae]